MMSFCLKLIANMRGKKTSRTPLSDERSKWLDLVWAALAEDDVEKRSLLLKQAGDLFAEPHLAEPPLHAAIPVRKRPRTKPIATMHWERLL